MSKTKSNKKESQKRDLKTKRSAKPSAAAKKASGARVGTGKAAPAKAIPFQKKPAKVVAETVEPPPAVPTRAPVRKIVGEGKVLQIVAKAAVSERSQTTESQPVEEQQAPKLEVITSQMTSAPRAAAIALPTNSRMSAPALEVAASAISERELGEKRSWSELPKSFPPRIRFLMAITLKECEQAGAWPFSFSKCIASLPKEICGVDFGLLLLSLDLNLEEVAQCVELDLNEVVLRIKRASAAIDAGFAKHCPDLYRKTIAQLGSVGKSVESIFEQYLVAKVDTQFQFMIGEVLLKALGAENSVVDGRLQRDKWSFNAKSAH